MKEMARADSAWGPSHHTVILLLSSPSTGKSPKAESHGLSERPQKQRAECSGDASLQANEHLFPVFLSFSPWDDTSLVQAQSSEHSRERSRVSAVLVFLWWLRFTEAGGKKRWSCFRLCFACLNFGFWFQATPLLLFSLQQERSAEMKVLWMARRG